MNTEADTYRKYVVPKLLACGWDTKPHSIADQRTVTDRWGIPVSNKDCAEMDAMVQAILDNASKGQL